MLKQSLLPLALGVLLAVALAPSPAQAAGSFELFGGYYVLAGDAELGGFENLEVDDDIIWGGRFGYKFSDKAGWLVSVGTFDVDNAIGGPLLGSQLELELIPVDFSLVYYPKGEGFYFYGGAGWATGDAELRIPGSDNNPKVSDDAFSLNLGLGYEFDIGERGFIRLDGKGRWLDLQFYSELDFEPTIGFGWRFGG